MGAPRHGQTVTSDEAAVTDVGDNTPFADYYAELTAALSLAGSALSETQRFSGTDKTRADERLKDARKHVDECFDLVNSLEMEMQSLPAAQRHKLRPIVKRAREAVSHQRGRLRTIRGELDALGDAEARVRLLKAGNSEDIEAMREHMRMSDATSDLEAASRSLADSRRTVSDTEMIGASILQDLQSQRATIVRARTNLGAVDAGIQQSSGILSSMHHRALINRIIIYVVGTAILLACLAVIYMRLFRHSHVVVDGVPSDNNSTRILN